MASNHQCGSLAREDAAELTTFINRRPRLHPWFRAHAVTLLKADDDRRLMTVVELLAGYEACVSWLFVDKLQLEGKAPAEVWVAEAWGLSTLERESGTLRSYGSGRAVELIYHAFNEANSRRLAEAVCWLNVDAELGLLLERCEFRDQGAGVWLRQVRRPPPGPLVRRLVTGGPDA